MTSGSESGRRSTGRRLADLLLWVGATVGVLSLLAAAAVALLGLVPLVFTSGSMAPDIPTGSLGIARTVPADDLGVGDVVSVESTSGSRVTHRIVAIDANSRAEDGTSVLTLKGDANESADQDPYVVVEADRLLFAVPWAGYALSALASPLGLFLGGVLAAAVVFYVVSGVRRNRPAPPGGGARRAGTARCTVAGVIALGVPGLLGLAPAQTTTAAFNDLGGTVTTSGFVAHRVAQPTDMTCASSGLNVTARTTVSDSRYTYWARAFNASGAAVTNYKPMTGSGATRSASFGTTDFLLNLDVGATYYLRVYSRVAGTTWESTDYRSHPFSRTLVLMNCGTPD